VLSRSVAALTVFSQQTQFSMAKIYELHEHFSSISGSISKDGLIDKAEFNKALGMKDSLFVDRVFTLFDKNSDGACSPAL
jgi:Ca2+-binding EF-hand superfamily protein